MLTMLGLPIRIFNHKVPLVSIGQSWLHLGFNRRDSVVGNGKGEEKRRGKGKKEKDHLYYYIITISAHTGLCPTNGAIPFSFCLYCFLDSPDKDRRTLRL